MKAENSLQQNDGVLIPFPEPRPAEDAQHTVSYDKPQNINIVQSFTHNSDIGVEIVITMPSVRISTAFYVTFTDIYLEATLPREGFLEL